MSLGLAHTGRVDLSTIVLTAASVGEEAGVLQAFWQILARSQKPDLRLVTYGGARWTSLSGHPPGQAPLSRSNGIPRASSHASSSEKPPHEASASSTNDHHAGPVISRSSLRAALTP